MLKKAFTLFELLITLAIISAIYFASIPLQKDSAIRGNIDTMGNDLIYMAENLIYNPMSGYTTNTGKSIPINPSDYCSKAFDVVNITPSRIKTCTSNPKYVLETTPDHVLNTNGNDPTKSWFKFAGESFSGCKVFIDDVDSYTVTMFIDCTSFPSEYYEYIENSVTASVKNKLNYYLSNDFNANTISTSTGNIQDGKFKINLKK